MGSIEDDCITVSGICIKCHACVRSCPTKAKYFDDPDFLSHVRMLEREYMERAENKIIL
jgi:ferredoxin